MNEFHPKEDNGNANTNWKCVHIFEIRKRNLSKKLDTAMEDTKWMKLNMAHQNAFTAGTSLFPKHNNKRIINYSMMFSLILHLILG